MRTFALALLVAATAVGGGACTDYFQGSQLVFEFDKLPPLHRIEPADKYDATANPGGELCADDAYAAAHADGEDPDTHSLYQQPYEYHAWATVNDAPVRIARFSVRECTLNSGDFTIKTAITTVSYVRLPAAQYSFPQKPSAWYGVVNGVLNAVSTGGAFISTPVDLHEATEVFITREAAGVTEDSGPVGTLLMHGNLVKVNQVLTAKLVKISGSASGLVTAIPTDRVSAW